MPVVKPKVISRRVVQERPEKLKRTLRIDDFYVKRKKILIIRGVGGLGDIFMHRMLFEDFKKTLPECEIHFACPKQYHDSVKDHPYIDCVLDSEKVQKTDYMISYNTTSACGRTEMKISYDNAQPGSIWKTADHRSDIWANHCGLSLASHNMHIHLTEDEKKCGKELLEAKRDRPGPIVLVTPVSAMHGKNLQDHQLEGLINGLHERGCCPIGMHSSPIYYFYRNGLPEINGVNLRKWMGIIHAADYVVSVDTAAFHCAGGMGKPLVGIFTFADGKVYGKYFDFLLVQKHRADDPCWTCGPCYNWGACPKTKLNPKPCLTELTPKMILEKVDRMFEKWPKTSLS